MEKSSPSNEGGLLTEFILEIFRANGQLLAAGDRLTAEFGLTSARWQVMGAIGNGAIPVVQIAHKMGLRRQSVQRIVDVLAAEKLLEFQENPHHQRAKLVKLTEIGWEKLQQVELVQEQWALEIVKGLDEEKLRSAIELLQEIRHRLDVCK